MAVVIVPTQRAPQVVRVLVPGAAGASLPPGQPGQVLGYGPDGTPQAISLPDGTLPAGQPGQIVGFGVDGTVVAVDAPEPATWASLADKPTTFPPADHSHALSDVSGLQAALDDKAPTAHIHEWAEIGGKPATFAPSEHSHAIADVTGLQTALDGKAATSHTHAWPEVTGKPTTFPPAAHRHAIADVTGLQAALDSKQPTTTFKTVNGETVTGTGNISIPAGPPPPVVITATPPANPVNGTFYVVTA